MRKLCEWKKVKIIEAEVYPDHIHMLVEIPPKYLKPVTAIRGWHLCFPLPECLAFRWMACAGQKIILPKVPRCAI